jgi:hypothetical protein
LVTTVATPLDARPRDEAELPGSTQHPEAAVNVDEDGRAYSRRVEVHVLGEGGAERHVEVVGEILSRPLALPPAERLVEGGGLREAHPQVVLGVELFLGREVAVEHSYLPSTLRHSGRLSEVPGVGRLPVSPMGGSPCS